MLSTNYGDLVPEDELLTHQIVDTFATVGQSDPLWTEKIWTIAHARDNSLQLVLGVGKYTNRGVFDGMILAATQRIDPRIELLESAEIPFVTLGRSTSGGDYPWIDLDFEGVAHTAIDRFVAAGHRRIAVTLPLGNINFGQIFENAYRDALERNGIAFDPRLMFVTVSPSVNCLT